MSKREKIRTIVIDEVEIVTSLSATDIASLEKENKELKKQLELKDKIIDEMQNKESLDATDTNAGMIESED